MPFIVLFYLVTSQKDRDAIRTVFVLSSKKAVGMVIYNLFTKERGKWAG